MVKNLSLTIAACLFSVCMFAAEKVNVDGIIYQIENDEAAVVQQSLEDDFTFLGGTVVIPEQIAYGGETYTVTALNDNAFRDTDIESITLPSTITSWGSNIFYDCESLTDVNLPDNMTILPGGCFWNCENLETVEIPSGITEFGSQCFRGCSNLKSIELPSALTTIGTYCFYDCISLEAIVIPTGVTELPASVFQNCESLVSVELPSGITGLGNSCFDYCPSLASIQLTSEGGGGTPTPFSLTETNELPSELTTLGNKCFRKCSSLTTIELPSGVTELGNSCFIDCSALTEVICYAVEPPTLGTTVFSGVDVDNCTLYVPNGSKSEYEATSQWNDFGNIEEMEVNSFSGTVNVDGIYYELEDGEATIVQQNHPDGLYYSSLTGDVVVPEKIVFEGTSYPVVTINTYAFRETDIESITLPSSITTWGNSLFYQCESLKEVVMPDNLEAIPTGCFKECPSLESVTLPSSLTVLGDQSFYECYSLKSIELPDGLTTIGTYCFTECSSLESIVIPKGVTAIPASAFQYCESLVSVELPSGITTFGNYSFDGCTSLESIQITGASDDGTAAPFSLAETNELPSELTSLGSSCFRNCSSLTTIELPSGVTEIGNNGFKNCTALTEVICYAVEPPTLGTTVFDGVILEECTLYVPYRSKADYEATSQWNEFGNIVEMEGGDDGNIDEIYAELMDKMAEVAASLEDAWNTISTEYSDVSDQFAEVYYYLAEVLETLKLSVDECYEEGDLEDVVDLAYEMIADVEEGIEEMLAAAKAAHEDVSGIDGVTYDSENTAKIYDMSGRLISSPVKGGINIIKYNDGTVKKVLVK